MKARIVNKKIRRDYIANKLRKELKSKRREMFEIEDKIMLNDMLLRMKMYDETLLTNEEQEKYDIMLEEWHNLYLALEEHCCKYLGMKTSEFCKFR